MAAAAAASAQTFKRNFTDLEWKAIWEAGESEEEQQDCFRCHWSLKEAFTKARGDGIAFDLSRCVRAPAALAPAARGQPCDIDTPRFQCDFLARVLSNKARAVHV
jgi:phosphopantetheinyl transferase